MNEDATPKPDAALPAEGPKAHPVRVRFFESESGIKCVFRGRLDAEAAAEIERDLKPRLAEAAGKRIVFELSAVDYAASAFLRLCIMAAKASGGDFALLAPTPDVKKTLRMAGLDSLIRTP